VGACPQMRQNPCVTPDHNSLISYEVRTVRSQTLYPTELRTLLCTVSLSFGVKRHRDDRTILVVSSLIDALDSALKPNCAALALETSEP